MAPRRGVAPMGQATGDRTQCRRRWAQHTPASRIAPALRAIETVPMTPSPAPSPSRTSVKTWRPPTPPKQFRAPQDPPYANCGR
jgi:hypothetical protein